MPVAEADPFLDLIPDNLIGGENGAPAFQQDQAGGWSEVPRAQLNSLPAPDVDAFSDLVPTTNLGVNSSELVDAGSFSDLIPKPKSETEKALAETPVYNPKNEQIRAAPTFFGELHAGRLGSAYYLAKEIVANQFKGQEIEPGRGKPLFGTTERLPDERPPGMDPLQFKVAKAFINVANKTMAAVTGPEMLPLAVIGGAGGAAGKIVAGAFGADIASHAPETWAAIQEADKTEPFSDKRFETAMDTVLQGLMLHGTARHAFKKASKIPVESSEAPPATTELPAEQTQAGAESGSLDAVPVDIRKTGYTPAILTRTGEVLTGPSHDTILEWNPGTDWRKRGFVDNANGDFVSTLEIARRRMMRTPQLSDNPAQRMVPIAEIPKERLPPDAYVSPDVPGAKELNQKIQQWDDFIEQKGNGDWDTGVHRLTDEELGQWDTAKKAVRDAESQHEISQIGNLSDEALVDTLEHQSNFSSADSYVKALSEQVTTRNLWKLYAQRHPQSAEVILEGKIPEFGTNARQIEPTIETVAEIPKNLRRSPEVDRLINEPEAQTGPQMKMAAPTEGGALGFGGGKRVTIAPKGTTPRGDTEFLRIAPGYKRIFKGLERKGAADVLGETKNKVGKLLSEATRKHVDIEQELFGRISTELIRPIKSVPKKVAAKAFDEVAGYLAAKENGRPLPTISPTAKNLVTAWENIADKTGKIAAANGVEVFDPALNASRPMHTIGRQYVPRMFKAEVEQVMRDPASNPRLWNDLVTDFAAQRKIPEADAANQLTREAGKFSSNDFMGNLEMARTGKMPESFYEYDLRNIAARYIPNFSERMAQIISYGQRLGPRENPTRPNLWDVARKESRDPYTQDWLNNAENQAINLKQKGTAAIGMARAQTAASGLLLSSPTTTVMRNLISGMSATPELLGVRRSLKGFAETIRNRQTRMDAKEIGTVRDNIADFLHADRLSDSPVDNAIRSVVDAGLKYSGYNGSEVFVRTHGTVTAAQFAKDAVAALQKKPTSMRSKEALGLFKRTGVDAAKIVAENADWKTGTETRKFIRTVIRDTQGGYRFDQVPLWANSNMGRFFFQFGRWGTQRARNIWQNGIKPALGEEVQWHGKTMTRRDIRPLAKMLAETVVLGETFAGIAQVLFGRDRRDASLSEIAAVWKEDEKTAVGLALQRMVNDVIMAGTLGIWSQPIDWAKGLKDQSRLKNPMEPPGLGSLTAFKELGQNMIDQGGELTRRDLWKFTASLVPGVKQAADVARNVMDEPLYEAENDVRTLRNAAHRWADSAGLDVSPKAKGDFRKSPLAPEYEPIKEALLVGDAQRAKFLKAKFLDNAPDRAKASQSLKASIRQSQPFRAGPYTAKVHRDNFMEWAKKNLNEDDFKQAQRIQERYQRAAVAANLW